MSGFTEFELSTAATAASTAASHGDIKLDDEGVTIEGNFLKSTTADIMLDHPSRRKSTTGERRALVHDPSDGLTINYDKDYPGGVTIRGDLKVDAITSPALNVKSTDIILDNAGRRTTNTGLRRALVHNSRDGLTINWGCDYPGGVTISGDVDLTQKLTVAGKDIASTLSELQAQINAIKHPDDSPQAVLTQLQEAVDSLDTRIEKIERLIKRIPGAPEEGPTLDPGIFGRMHGN